MLITERTVKYLELTPRKCAILTAIIDSYIISGEPVGSKALCDMLEYNLSSATLRNEMSDLCNLGLLHQPHTSAGRVPTCSGYKLYVDSLMENRMLSPEVKLAIDSALQTIAHTPEQMPFLACQLLADLIGLPSFAITLTNTSARVKRVRIIPMGKRTLLMVVISTDGVAKSRIVLSDCDIDEKVLSVYSNICKSCIIGHRLFELNTAYLQSIVARLGGFSLSILPLLSTMFEIIEEMFEPQVIFKGETNLFSGYKHQAPSSRLGELLSNKDTLIALVQGFNNRSQVIFSDEYSLDAKSEPSAIIVSKFFTGAKELGRIGVVGPARMSYEHLIPTLEYFAQSLGSLMTKAMQDMED